MSDLLDTRPHLFADLVSISGTGKKSSQDQHVKAASKKGSRVVMAVLSWKTFDPQLQPW
jgi:hypothetical protein